MLGVGSSSLRRSDVLTGSDCAVFVGFILLFLLLATVPADFVWAWPGLFGARLLLAGAGLIFALAESTPRERLFLQSVTRPALVGFFAVAIWLLLQLVPAGPLAHPFWTSAASALHHPVAGTISIDVGATFLAFAHFSLIVAVSMLAAMLSLDRMRAEWLLFGLAALTALGSAWMVFGNVALGADLFAFDWLALILAVAAANLVVERFETRRTRQAHAGLRLIAQGGACLLAVLAAGAAILRAADPAILFIAIVVTGLMVFLIAWRRFGLGPIAGGAIAVLFCAVAIVSAGSRHMRAADPTLAFSSAAASDFDVARRMIGDAPWAGTGAGTFESLRPLYRSYEDIAAPEPASGAALLTIELGKVAFWLVAALTVFLIFRLLRGALFRGRDSFYPLAGAACLTALLLGSFINAGAISTPVGIFASAILGLALAQSDSRTIQS